MSQYGYLTCTDCGIFVWLGKAIFNVDEAGRIKTSQNDAGVKSFHQGPAEEPPNWERVELSRKIWEMFARHTGHSLRVMLEDEFQDFHEKRELHEFEVVRSA